jgi:hypothetical protein
MRSTLPIPSTWTNCRVRWIDLESNTMPRMRLPGRTCRTRPRRRPWIYSRTRSVVIPDELLRRHRILTGRDQLCLSQLKRMHAGNEKQTR